MTRSQKENAVFAHLDIAQGKAHVSNKNGLKKADLRELVPIHMSVNMWPDYRKMVRDKRREPYDI